MIPVPENICPAYKRQDKKAGEYMPDDLEITKAAIDDFKEIQEYMVLAKEENAERTYAKLKKSILL